MGLWGYGGHICDPWPTLHAPIALVGTSGTLMRDLEKVSPFNYKIYPTVKCYHLMANLSHILTLTDFRVHECYLYLIEIYPTCRWQSAWKKIRFPPVWSNFASSHLGSQWVYRAMGDIFVTPGPPCMPPLPLWALLGP